jgi:hypothetical protein
MPRKNPGRRQQQGDSVAFVAALKAALGQRGLRIVKPPVGPVELRAERRLRLIHGGRSAGSASPAAPGSPLRRAP